MTCGPRRGAAPHQSRGRRVDQSRCTTWRAWRRNSDRLARFSSAAKLPRKRCNRRSSSSVYLDFRRAGRGLTPFNHSIDASGSTNIVFLGERSRCAGTAAHPDDFRNRFSALVSGHILSWIVGLGIDELTNGIVVVQLGVYDSGLGRNIQPHVTGSRASLCHQVKAGSNQRWETLTEGGGDAGWLATYPRVRPAGSALKTRTASMNVVRR